MPLSEEELRALEQMERALVQEDPKLASTLRGTNLRRAARRRAILAGVCFVAGIGVLMAGAIGRVTLVGILGFVVMLASATIALAAIRGTSGGARRTPSTRGRPDRLDARPVRHPVAPPPRQRVLSEDVGDRREPSGAAAAASRDSGVSQPTRPAPTGLTADALAARQPTWSTTPPAATASGSRSQLGPRRGPTADRRTASAAASVARRSVAAHAAVLQRRDAGLHVLGQGAGHVVRVAGVAHPLEREHDPVERVLGTGRQSAAARRPHERRPVAARGRTRPRGGGPSRAVTGRPASRPRGRRRCRAARPRRPRRRRPAAGRAGDGVRPAAPARGRPARASTTERRPRTPVQGTCAPGTTSVLRRRLVARLLRGWLAARARRGLAALGLVATSGRSGLRTGTVCWCTVGHVAGAAAGGGLEAHPARPAEVQLGPGVQVVRAVDPLVRRRHLVRLEEADGDPGRDVQRARHHRERRGELLAVADAAAVALVEEAQQGRRLPLPPAALEAVAEATGRRGTSAGA